MSRSKRKKLSSVKFFRLIVFLGLISCFLIIHFKNRDGIDKINGPDTIYLAVGEISKLNLDVKYKSSGSLKLYYDSEDKDIVEINNGVLTAKDEGTTKVEIKSVSEIEKNINIIVTDLITPPTYVQEKDELPCNKYNDEESHILDEILKTNIQNAGYKTRAGVVEAARFLSLRFPYKINYFYENGRLNDSTREYIDGEGRYYHIGLYLSDNKFDSLEENASTSDPVIWGCDLYANYVKTYSRNGLNCSGFISWAMLNGGFDIGDIGAGITEQYDFTDVGEKISITDELLKSSKVKVGDLIGRNGHIAIIIGIEDNKIYIAESYMPSMKVRVFTFNELVESDDFKYIMLMDSIYKNDGNLTNMW